MKIHMSRRLFLPAAVLGGVAVIAAVFFVALAVHSVVAGPSAAPGDVSHTYDQIGLPPGGAPWPGLVCESLGADGLEADDFWQLDGNAGTTPGTDFLGTTDSNDLELHVDSSPALRLAHGATISGGGESGSTNVAHDHYGTIGGGRGNVVGSDDADPISQWYATVGGGSGNTANGIQATVGGGSGKSARGLQATIGGGSANEATHELTTVAGGLLNDATAEWATVGGGTGNKARNKNSTVGGGTANDAFGCVSTIGGGSHNEAGGLGATVGGGAENDTTDNYTTVGGGEFNQAGNPDTILGNEEEYATIGGGLANDADGKYATIGGGTVNTVYDNYGTIGGGGDNTAGDSLTPPTDEPYATVGGGLGNTAWKKYSTVGGGANNSANGEFSTVAGGNWNTAGGNYSTVPGGNWNSAGGKYSLAAGRRAVVDALHNGTFLFADESNYDFDSQAANEFAVRAVGGSRIVTGIDGSGDPDAGVKLDPDDNAWEVLSDRDAKENFVVLDLQDVLNRLAGVPITEWNYKSQDPSNRHIGPMAQDFYAAFGLSDDELYISPIDTDGIALAAIQGLYELSQEQAERIDALEGENADLHQQLDDLEARVSALDGGAPASNASNGSSGPLAASFTMGGLLLGGLFLGGLVLVQRWRAGGRS